MSPILVRPVREQLEHDRIIRLLQTKYRRRHEANINVGAERAAPVGSGPSAVYPDIVLISQDRARRVEAIVEVETGESVNHLEALAQWAVFGRMRAAFHLYVPSGMVDVARRLCEDNKIRTSEIWSFHTVGDEVRFTLVHRSRESLAAAPKSVAAKPARKAAVKSGAVKSGGAKLAAKPAAAKPAVRKARPAPAKRSARAKPAARSRVAKKPARTQKRK